MSEYFVPTKSCPSSSSHKVHEFKSNTNKKGKQTESVNSNEDNIELVEMSKARFEVYKFAQSGLPNPERQKSQFELALKLGAVPRKNKVINYKQLKEEREAKRKAELERMTLMEKNIKRRIREKPKDPKCKLRRKRKIGAGILKSYGKAGKK